MSAAASSLSVDDRLDLITRGLAEVLGRESIRQALEESAAPGSTRVVKLYWGTATTGRRE